MSGLIETLWQQFAVEAGEHADAIEKHLSDTAAAAEPERDRVAALFRSFHSLKGAARAMDLFAMEAVAHRAETVLGRVRSGAAGLEPATVEVLLEALDALRTLTDLAARERRDGTAPAALLARLDALGGSGGPAAPAAPAAAEPPRPARLHDNEKLLGLFVDHLREGMATLTRALDIGSLDGEGMRAVDDTAERLEIACERLSFLPFADTFRAFRAALAGGDDEGVLRALQAVAQASARVGRLSNRDAGTAILATLLSDHNAQAIARNGQRALALLSDPASTDGSVAEALERMAAALDIARLPQAATLARRTADAARRAAPPPSGSGEEWSAGLLRVVAMLVERVTTDPPADLDTDTAAALDAELRTVADAASRDTPVAVVTAEELAELGLDPHLLRFLSPESTALLRTALADPATGLYEITAYLESSEAVASGFAAWLGAAVTAITNWPEFIDGKTWLKILIATTDDLATLRTALAAIDSGGTLLQVRRCAAGLPSDDVAPPGTAPAAATQEEQPEARQVQVAAPAVATAPPAKPQPLAASPASGVLRVTGEIVDRFMARIDSMVLLSADLNRLANDIRLEEAMGALASRLGTGDPDLRVVQDLLERHRRGLADLDVQLSRSVDRLRESALDLRVVPVETLFNQFPRVVRELARAQGKKVRLVVDGGGVRIDKSMVETLYDPLMHMVRNGIDHGIEPPDDRELQGKPAQATIGLRAIQRNNRVTVEIADDGRGIDAEAVRARAVRNGLVSEEESRRLSTARIHDFLFDSGFSTAERVTETSGRGVGMDVARDAVTRLGGSIAIDSEPGHGTVFSIDLPLSAAIVRTLLVQAGDQVLAIPDRFVEEVCGFTTAEFHRVADAWTVLRRDRVLPVVPLADALGLPASGEAGAGGTGGPADAQRLVVVLRQGDRRIGVEIDRLLRRGDLFVRDSHPGLGAVPGVGGVSLLNDGRIVIILDGDALFHLACAAQAHGRHTVAAPAAG